MAFVPETGVTALIGSINTGPITLAPGINCEAFAMIGSQVIPGAAHEGSDIDVAVLVDEEQGRILVDVIELDLDGERNGSAGASDDGMESLKVEHDGKTWNYLLFLDSGYFHAFVNATTVCVHFGVTDKALRVELFAMLTDGVCYEGALLKHVKIHTPPADLQGGSF